MSGSGGFPKFRCKYWSSHNCDNWVWVNGRACVYCVSAGRDDASAPGQQMPVVQTDTGVREFCIPLFEDGRITYVIVEVIGIDQAGNRSLRAKAVQQPAAQIPMTTSSMPGIISTDITAYGGGYR